MAIEKKQMLPGKWDVMREGFSQNCVSDSKATHVPPMNMGAEQTGVERVPDNGISG